MKAAGIAVVLAVVWAEAASADVFLRNNALLEMCTTPVREVECHRYIQGVVDLGISLSTWTMPGYELLHKNLRTCTPFPGESRKGWDSLSGWDMHQLQSAIVIDIAAQPDKGSYNAAGAVWTVFLKTWPCPPNASKK